MIQEPPAPGGASEGHASKSIQARREGLTRHGHALGVARLCGAGALSAAARAHNSGQDSAREPGACSPHDAMVRTLHNQRNLRIAAAVRPPCPWGGSPFLLAIGLTVG